MFRLRSRLSALVVAILLLLPSTGFARVVHLCGTMGQVVTSCCCGDGSVHIGTALEDDDVGGQTSVRRAPCCQAEVEQTPAPPAGSVSAGIELPASALFDLTFVVASIDQLSEYHAVPPARCRAPPPVGRPLYLQHRALLS